MTFDKFILWFTVMAPIVYSAGPNNLMCASIGARYSFKKSLPFILGVNSNIFLYSLLTGFGLGKLLESYPDIYIYIKYAGSAYILYLAYRFFRSSGIKTSENSDTQTPGFWSGFLLNTLNPKAFTALLIMYSQFLDDHYTCIPPGIPANHYGSYYINIFTLYMVVRGILDFGQINYIKSH